LGKLLGTQSIRRQLFKGTKAYAIGLAQGPIHGPSFGHSHLGVVEDQGRNIPWVGIPIADKPPALGGLIDSGFEDPEAFFGAAQGNHWLDLDASTTLLPG
jgi:hypothetical protein